MIDPTLIYYLARGIQLVDNGTALDTIIHEESGLHSGISVFAENIVTEDTAIALSEPGTLDAQHWDTVALTIIALVTTDERLAQIGASLERKLEEGTEPLNAFLLLRRIRRLFVREIQRQVRAPRRDVAVQIEELPGER